MKIEKYIRERFSHIDLDNIILMYVGLYQDIGDPAYGQIAAELIEKEAQSEGK